LSASKQAFLLSIFSGFLCSSLAKQAFYSLPATLIGFPAFAVALTCGFLATSLVTNIISADLQKTITEFEGKCEPLARCYSDTPSNQFVSKCRENFVNVVRQCFTPLSGRSR